MVEKHRKIAENVNKMKCIIMQRTVFDECAVASIKPALNFKISTFKARYKQWQLGIFSLTVQIKMSVLIVCNTHTHRSRYNLAAS